MRSETLGAELVAVATHELRAPLTSLVGYASTLREHRHDLSDADLDRCIAAIDRQAQRLSALVDDLLAASMAGTGSGRALANERVDVAAAVHAALMDIRCDRHEVLVDIPDDLPDAAGHTASLERVLVNLLANAQRYSEPGSRIDVRVDAGTGGISISVRDRGPGIAADVAGDLFTMFARSAGGPAQSCGIGLYVVDQLTRAMGATVAVQSELGVGTCFTVTLPLAAPATLPVGAPAILPVAGVPAADRATSAPAAA